MAIKKSELHSSLWQSCDALRNGIDVCKYKDHVLMLPFVKHVSDKYRTRCGVDTRFRFRLLCRLHRTVKWSKRCAEGGLPSARE